MCVNVPGSWSPSCRLTRASAVPCPAPASCSEAGAAGRQLALELEFAFEHAAKFEFDSRSAD